jgi:hypothetical protein
MVPGLLNLDDLVQAVRTIVYQRLKRAVIRATLAQVHFVVADHDVRTDDPLAGRTNAPGQLIEHVIGIGFAITDLKVTLRRVGHFSQLCRTVEPFFRTRARIDPTRLT